VPEYWIVDLEAASVEVWRLAERAEMPEVVPAGGTLRWTPVTGGPTLEISPAELVEGT